ncbi:hypothetical protein V865_003292 [Kwoniella europaea PYCC6329]|uniref:Uncharacterized protein n=1 Tax=Kwoniella europaea PYCC6329 TaxID=1423913 RepID=A0AAX4KGU3_9TREE
MPSSNYPPQQPMGGLGHNGSRDPVAGDRQPRKVKLALTCLTFRNVAPTYNLFPVFSVSQTDKLGDAVYPELQFCEEGMR